MSAHLKRIIIISPDLSTNALGRVVNLYDLLKGHFQVEIIGIKSKPFIWNNAHLYYPIKEFEGKNTLQLLTSVPSNRHLLREADLIIASKPLATSIGYLNIISKNKPIILDIDDYETGHYKTLGPMLNLCISLKFPLWPNNIITSSLIESRINRFPTKLFSSNALKEWYRSDGVIIPHVKPPDFYEEKDIKQEYKVYTAQLKKRENDFVLGFIGTPRKYKGLDFIIRNIDKIHASDRNVVLLMTGGDPKACGNKIINIPFCSSSFLPLKKIYPFIDVLILLQGTSLNARLQSPSKMFDAMFFGKPVVATDSKAFREYLPQDVLIPRVEVGELNKKLAQIAEGRIKQYFKISYNKLLEETKQNLLATVRKLI